MTTSRPLAITDLICIAYPPDLITTVQSAHPGFGQDRRRRTGIDAIDRTIVPKQEKASLSVDLVAEIKVTDQAWIPDYVSHVHDIVHKHGGKYLSRSANIKSVEGERPDATVVALRRFHRWRPWRRSPRIRLTHPTRKLVKPEA